MLIALTQTEKSEDIVLFGTSNTYLNIPNIGSVKVVDSRIRKENIAELLNIIQNAENLYVVGADIVDGYYDPLLPCTWLIWANHAGKIGVNSRIIGFSFNRNPHPSSMLSIKLFTKHVKVFIRDPISLKRFESHFPGKAHITADIAFLLEPSQVSDDFSQWKYLNAINNKIVIGVNFNFHAFRDLSILYSAKELSSLIARNLPREVHGRACSYVLIPHDLKESSGDLSILKDLADSLKDINISNYFYYSRDPREIKSVTQNLDLLISGRMHLAIAALGSGIPTIGIEYQDKFGGLFTMFGLLDFGLLIRPDECLSNSLAERIAESIDSISMIRERIKENVIKVNDLARINIKG